MRNMTHLKHRETLRWLLNPNLLAKLDPTYVQSMVEIQNYREAIRQRDLHGRYNLKAAGFSPQRGFKTAAELPYTVWALAKGVESQDIFVDRQKRKLFLEDFPEYSLEIKR